MISRILASVAFLALLVILAGRALDIEHDADAQRIERFKADNAPADYRVDWCEYPCDTAKVKP